jgi:hypothetical protein
MSHRRGASSSGGAGPRSGYVEAWGISIFLLAAAGAVPTPSGRPSIIRTCVLSRRRIHHKSLNSTRPIWRIRRSQKVRFLRLPPGKRPGFPRFAGTSCHVYLQQFSAALVLTIRQLLVKLRQRPDARTCFPPRQYLVQTRLFASQPFATKPRHPENVGLHSTYASFLAYFVAPHRSSALRCGT